MQKQPYAQNEKSALFHQDPRARLILEKARYYRVSPLSNEYLLAELFMLDSSEVLSNGQLKVFSEFAKACHKSVEEAQMSK